MKVVYFGTPQFAANVLSYLLDHGVDVVGVVTKPDRPKGRSSTPVPTPVKGVALSRTPPLPLLQPALISDSENTPLLEAFQADLFVVVAFGEIIKQHLLDMPKVACINLHASLLPKYRGAAPIQRSIINGEKQTGLTVMHMTKKMDAGDIISTKAVPIGPDTTYGELEEQLCRAGSELLLQAIHSFENGTAQRIPQDHSLATMAPKIELEDCLIDWKLPASTIHNLVRGVTPHPGAWCQVKVKGELKRLRVITTKVSPGDTGATGKILSLTPEGLLVACGIGALYIQEMQLEGKKPMPVQDFFRGMPLESFLFILQ